MQRYFIKEEQIKNNTVTITGNDSHHIRNVMRMKPKDTVIVCNNGVCYYASIKGETNGEVYCDIVEQLPINQKEFQVTIAQGLIRRERFEYMLQKATELGVDEIIPMNSSFSIIKIKHEKSSKKIERWNTITKEASEQSHRSKITKVHEICELHNLPFNEFDLILVAYEKENKSNHLKEVLKTKYKNILVVIGPEGGLSPKEVEFLENQPNTELVGLGRRILRSETASTYLLSVLHYEYEMII